MSDKTLSNQPDNNIHPAVMAYIGDDDPHRGDTKAAIGLASLIAEMTQGRYVYVDAAMLEKSFPALMYDTTMRLKAYLMVNGEPDIVIGTSSRRVEDLCEKPPLVTVSEINESLSERAYKEDDQGNNMGLVSHHLTNDLLKQAGEEFKKRYPKVRGPLVAVMMGGGMSKNSSIELAKKLNEIGHSYPEITFFLCPSRRTGRTNYEYLKEALAHPFLQSLSEKFNNQTLNEVLNLIGGFNELAQKLSPLKNKINIMGVDYKSAKTVYNPYLGLLANADHIVVAGQSYSLVSEALFTGKNIYVYEPDANYGRLKDKGYVCDISDLLPSEGFSTHPMEPLDLTRSVATAIVKEYRETLAAHLTPLGLLGSRRVSEPNVARLSL